MKMTKKIKVKQQRGNKERRVPYGYYQNRPKLMAAIMKAGIGVVEGFRVVESPLLK